MNRILPLAVATAAMMIASVVQAQGRSPRGSMSMSARGMSPSSMRSSMSSRMSGSSFRAPTSSMRAPSANFRAPSSSFRTPSSSFRAPTASFRPPTSSRSLSVSRSIRSPYVSPLYGSSRISYGVRSPRSVIGATIPRTSLYYGTGSLRYPSSYYGSRYRSPGISYGVSIPYATSLYGFGYGYGYAPSVRLEYRSPTASNLYAASTYRAPDYDEYRAEADYLARIEQLQRLERLEQELRQRSARPAVPPVSGASSAPQQLAASLASMQGGEVWVDYLQPQRVATALEQGDRATLSQLALNYIGVSQNPSLSNVSSLPGFAKTSRMLQPYANIQDSAAPVTSAAPEMSLAPAARTPDVAPAIEPGTESILEEADAAPQPEPETADAPEELPLPVPQPQVDEI